MKTIKVDVSDLGRMLPVLTVRRACAYSVRLVDVPHEVSNVQFSAVRRDGEVLNPVPCSQVKLGEWKASLPATLFSSEGRGDYEVWGLNPDGGTCALGRGVLLIAPFASGDALPVAPDGRQIITAIPDRSGRLHNVVAEEVDGEYTWIIED